MARIGRETAVALCAAFCPSARRAAPGYQAHQELVDDLQRFLDLKPVRAWPAFLVGRVQARPRRLRLASAVTVEGRPSIKSTLSFEPPPDFVAETLDDFVMLGLTITAMPAITAIPAVVAAPAGIATYTDLPLLLPRGVLAPR